MDGESSRNDGAQENCLKPLCRAAIGILWLAFFFLFGGAPASAADGASGWVDERVCADCHAEVSRRWRQSQHARSMQAASAETVLGDFSGGAFATQEPRIRFTHRDGRFAVRAPAADGRLRNFDVTHAFGVAPLQQYLLRGENGRLQALTVAWDTVRKRWFSLYPDGEVEPSDPRHWSGPGANWNTMCASCHSGGVQKRYELAADRYDTRYETVSVGCQACHGPAASHLERVRAAAPGETPAGASFALRPDAPHARQVDGCAQCHAFRTQLLPQHEHRERFLDQYLPVLLSEGNYFPDGQQQGEVFVWGSWLQSRMHQRGLVCSDCHDVHSGGLHAAGDALCTSCHGPAGPAAARVRAGIDFSGLELKDYAGSSHHRHGDNPPACVDCHAGRRDYMVVDGRLDHAFRVPRPDVAARTGAPDPCTACHRDKDARWAAQALDRWQGAGRQRPAHYGDAFAAARKHEAGAATALLAVAGDGTKPAIVRATAMQLLAAFPGAGASRVLRQGAGDADPLVRLGALQGAAALEPATFTAVVSALLADPVRSVRIAAAGTLLPRSQGLQDAARTHFDKALAEYEAAQRENADRPEGLINLARLALLHRGQAGEAENYLRLAVARHPRFIPAHIALAEVLRQRAGESAAERQLRDALQLAPDQPALREALGQSLVRQRRYREAEAVLAAVAGHAEASPTAVLLHAGLLGERGDAAAAIAVIESALGRLGGRRELLLALAALQARRGASEDAAATLERLAGINPDDPALQGRR